MLSPVCSTGWAPCNGTSWVLPSWKVALLKRISEQTIWTCVLSALLQQGRPAASRALKESAEQDKHKHTGIYINILG